MANNNLGKVINVNATKDLPAFEQTDYYSTLMLSDIHPGWATDRVRIYTSPSQMLADGFNSDSWEYKHANIYFSAGDVRPQKLYVGYRIPEIAALTGTAVGISATVTVPTNDETITFSVNGKVMTVTSDSTATDAEIAILIQDAINNNAELSNLVATATLAVVEIVDVYQKQLPEFVVNNNIHTTQITIGSVSDANVTGPTAIEDIADCVAAIETQNCDWFGVFTTITTESELLDISAEIETRKKLFGVSTDSTVSLTLRNQLVGLTREHTFYVADTDSTNGYGAAAMFFGDRMWTTPGASTWHQATPKGILIFDGSETELENALGSPLKANAYLKIGNNSTFGGVVCSGEYIDVIRGLENLKSDIQIALTRRIQKEVRSGSKVGLSEEGVSSLKAELDSIMRTYQGEGRNFVKNDFFKTGVDGLPTSVPGYVITAGLVADMSTNDRALRKSPTLTVIMHLENAIHSAVVQLNLNV